MSSVLNLVFDFLIFAALSVVIYYCIGLSRQFTAIKEDRKAFENLIKAMNLATSKADSAVKNMRVAVVEETEALQEKINRAKGLGEELEIIIQAGDSLANRLEEVAYQKAMSPNHGSDYEDYDDDFKTQVEKNLLEAVRAKGK